MDERVLTAALAGLLHDIGKFAQRAGWQRGAHAEVGGAFVERYVPPQWHKGLYPVVAHHDRTLEGKEPKAVALADRLSASERADAAVEQPRQTLSILSCVVADGRTLDPEAYGYWPLRALALEEEILFPGPPLDDAAVRAAYGDLWEGFLAEAEALRDVQEGEGDLETYLESLLLAMQRYTWCVPSAYYRPLPDVSLYDHGRMTAALAACLVDRSEKELDALLAGRSGEERVALLVGGDISGVQDFIYAITDRGAASALRGRSFYLQLLTEAVVRYTLRELGLPATNLIYQGGGGFTLLARPDDVDRLIEIQRRVSRALLAHHRGDLYLALAWEPLAVADLSGERVARRWEAMSRAQHAAKQRRFSELGAKDLRALFTPQGHGGNEERECQVCGREDPACIGDTEVRKCTQCRSYEDLGQDLRKARYLWLQAVDPATLPDDPFDVTPGAWQDALSALGLRAGVAEDLGDIPDARGNRRLVLALDDDALSELRPGPRTVVGRRLLVNVTPIVERDDIVCLGDKIEERLILDAIKPFSALAASSTGIDRLGVLRMDVDDLGKLFEKGLGDSATLSRVAALSFAISLYFDGWVEHIVADLNAESRSQGRGDTLYSIYSGGDDLFAVGAWDQVVELACRVRADLTRFAAGHPGIHASAGIVLVGGKYPLAQAAKDAGEAERQAKALRWRDEQGVERTKDAVAFLGRTQPWVRFGAGKADQSDLLSTVHSLALGLRDIIADGVPRGLLQRLIQFQSQAEEAAEARQRAGRDLNRAGEEQILWGPWMWQGYYVLKRMADQNSKMRVQIEALAEGLHRDRFRSIEWIGLAARWADLLTRKAS